MKEYGGYIELDHYTGKMLHDKALALNSGRNCLAYLIRAKHIRKLVLPRFLCDSVTGICEREHTSFRFYKIRENFTPDNVETEPDEWLYIVNYYGQLTADKLKELQNRFGKIIIDNAQAYFDEPIPGADTIYTCRKFFGVADGAFLYTDAKLDGELMRDESFERMHFLLGRFERTASEFYSEYTANNHIFASEPIKYMSKLTDNLLHGINYEMVKTRRTENFRLYHELLGGQNKLKLSVPEGPFAYPFMIENGNTARKSLQKQKIYIPMLWPSVLEQCDKKSLEYAMAENILPLPCDQRYDAEDISYIAKMIERFVL